jgi:serine/threonine-protein phosphatase 2A regulatory subunit A
MATSLTADIIKEKVLTTVIELVDDPIPNVRFNVAKSLEVLAPILNQDPSTSELVSTKVAEVLAKLSQDKDVDVRWFAEKALLSGNFFYFILFYKRKYILILFIFIVQQQN